MRKQSVVPFLFTLALLAAALPGCRKDNNPVSTGSTAASNNVQEARLLGVWWHVGTLEGLQFDKGGSVRRLFVDVKYVLQIEPYDGPGDYYTPQEGVCVLSWLEQSPQTGFRTVTQRYSYVFAQNDSTLILSTADAKDEYVRKNLGELVQ
jgi:hypothetical protein